MDDGTRSFEHFNLRKFMDLVDAAEKAELKLRTDYQSNVAAEDLAHPMESYAEGEALRFALDALRFDILLHRVKHG